MNRKPQAPATPRAPFIDLHLHSHCSDGSDSPARVVERAHALGIQALSLTDHDTTGGLAEARAAANTLGIAFVSGVEVSCRHDDMVVHVLAYGFDPGNAPLQSLLCGLAEGRAARTRAILARLVEHGIEINIDDLRAPNGAHALTRMHIARLLCERGVTRTVQLAFDQFLNPGRPAWVPGTASPIDKAIDLIHAAGGVAILAHPYLNRRVKRSMDALLEYPFDGVEAWHSSHSRDAVQRLRILALDRKILATGGSDCHGSAKGKPEMGNVRTPLSCWEALRGRLGI
jgi:3',5'-nucleoside bisphosphate phosphatase